MGPFEPALPVLRVNRAVARLTVFRRLFLLGRFSLDFAGYVFDDAVGFEVEIVDSFDGLRVDDAFYLVELACGCVSSAVFHRGVPPGRFDE